MATPSSGSGGIMKFAKVKLGCMSCKAPLASGETSLCENCKAMVRGAVLACLSVTKPDAHNFDSWQCWLGLPLHSGPACCGLHLFATRSCNYCKHGSSTCQTSRKAAPTQLGQPC